MSNIAIYQEGFTDGFNEAKSKYERPQGEWIRKPITFGTCILQGYECNCGRVVMQRENFCPDCGADMRGKDNAKT